VSEIGYDGFEILQSVLEFQRRHKSNETWKK